MKEEEQRQLCTFFVDGVHFGIDVLSVQEVLKYQRMTRVPLAPKAVSGLINLRGQIVTAIDLRIRLGLPPRVSEKLPINVVVRTEEGAVALLVDEIGDVLEATASSFEQAPQTVAAASRALLQGVYKFENRLLMVLDTKRVLEERREEEPIHS